VAGEKLERDEPNADVLARRQRLTNEARRRHDALDAAIEALERALAAAGGRRAEAWTERVESELGRVQEAIDAHVAGIEEADGLFDEIEAHDPRLASHVEQLRREHRMLRDRAAAFSARLQPQRAPDVSGARREAAGLLTDLRAHRAAEADLVYEAFWTDIGAVD
jgi:hypothetical protein